jgi:SAM-dependent methyltransferase
VLELLETEPEGRILDAPAGTGELAGHLKKSGFEVFAADIDEKVCAVPGVTFQKVDLNERLPYPDHFFDHAVCVEGVEHLENPHHTIKELRRVTRPGGAIILTTPNILNIFSRVRYLLTGHYEYFGDYFAREENFYVLHINPVGFPEHLLALERNDLELEALGTNQDVLFTRGPVFGMLMAVLLVPIRLATMMKVRDKRLRRFLLSKELLGGQILILKCRRK